MVWSFIITCLASISLGLAFGMLITYIFKKLRFLYHSSVAENVLILLLGYIAYVTSEIL